MSALITGSELDWTLARINNPAHKAAAGTVRAGFLGRDPIDSTMSRADIAAFSSASSPTRHSTDLA